MSKVKKTLAESWHSQICISEEEMYKVVRKRYN